MNPAHASPHPAFAAHLSGEAVERNANRLVYPSMKTFAFVALAVVSTPAFAAEAAPAPSTPKQAPSPARIEITLISDGETWVSVANERMPAKFQTTKISLPPGRYELIGQRSGYRDVRKPLDVGGGMTAVSVTVICTEQGPLFRTQ